MATRASAVADYASLQQKFLQSDEKSFSAFAKAWRDLHFECIHIGCRPDAKEREELVLEFFEHIITFVSDDVGLDARRCAIFALYSVFITQRNQPRIKIRMTSGIWRYMKTLFAAAQEKGDVDVVNAIRSLCAECAFVFVVALNHRTDYDTTKKNTMKLWKYSEAEFGVPHELCAGYHIAKSNLMRSMKNGQEDLDQGIAQTQSDFDTALAQVHETFLTERDHRLRRVSRRGHATATSTPGHHGGKRRRRMQIADHSSAASTAEASGTMDGRISTPSTALSSQLPLPLPQLAHEEATARRTSMPEF
eukprot:m.111818 g.111818  ORF g.111818 m.111818 type:complete len:306 (-) comp17015_c0_seq1:281-1198(-)